MLSARAGWLHRTRPWTILVEREMRSGVMMILKIARQHAAQVTLAQGDDVIQAFTADRTDQSLNIWVLPGRSWSSDDLRDTHGANAMPGHTICPGLAADSVERCPMERPRSSGQKASLALDLG